MLMSAETDKILPALLIAKSKIKEITKGEDNPFFKSTYAGLPAVLEAIEGPLAEQKLMLLQPPALFQDGRRIVESFIVHAESGQFVGCQMEIIMEKASAQSQGSAVTYIRRQSALSLLGLKVVDDDGEAAVGRDNKAPAKPKAEDKPKLDAKIDAKLDKKPETPPPAAGGRVGFGRP